MSVVSAFSRIFGRRSPAEAGYHTQQPGERRAPHRDPAEAGHHADESGEADMTLKETVISQIQQVAEENGKPLPPLRDDLVLLDSGLDSLAIAILVARLEEA